MPAASRHALTAVTKQEKRAHKKSRGRPPGRAYGENIPVRMAPGMVAAVDRWATGKEMSRSEAIRALIERGLKK
jgi:hypothetical protein